MANLHRFFRTVLSAIADELDNTPNTDFSGVMSVANYRDDVHEATVTMTIQPHRMGQVKFQGSWWNARCNQDVTLMPGQVVYIVNRRDNTLYVEPGFMLRAMMPMLTSIPQPAQKIV